MSELETSFIDKLKQAIFLCETLKQENDIYKDNFEKVNDNFKALEYKHEKTSKETIIAIKEKESLQLEFEKYKQVQKQKLTEKEKEIKLLEKQNPSVLDTKLLKQELLDGLETRQMEKFNLVQNDLEKFRSLYFKIKKHFDCFQSESDLKMADLQKCLYNTEANYKAEITDLEMKISLLQTEIDDNNYVEKLRIMKREKIELELRVKALLEELEQVRAEKEQNNIVSQQNERNHKRQLVDYVNAVKSLDTEKQSLESNLGILKEQNREYEAKNSELIGENMGLRTELNKTAQKLEQVTHNLTLESSNSQLQLMKLKTEMERTLVTKENIIIQLENEKSNLTQTVTDNRDKLGALEKEYLDKLRLSKEQDWIQISQLEADKSNLEKLVMSLKQKSGELENANNGCLQEHVKESTRLKKELQVQYSLVEELRGLKSTLDRDLEMALKDIVTLNHSMEKSALTANQANSLVKTYEHNIQEMHESQIVLENKVKALQAEIVDSNTQSALEQEAYDHTLERQNVKYKQQVASQEQKLELMARDRLQLVERVSMIETVMERQQEIFQTKIVMLKERIKICRTETENMKSLLENEQKRSNMRKDEARKRQHGILDFLNQVQAN